MTTLTAFKTAFLFGAGASYDCGDIYPHQPPKGSELYSRLKDRFHESWGKLPTKLDQEFIKNNKFEEGMYCLWKNYPDLSTKLLKEFAIYFSEFVPRSKENGTNYHKLIFRLTERGKNDTLLTTINYDCLLDGELGANINYFFGPGAGCPIIKLHGSCNWFIDSNGMNEHVSFTSDVRFDPDSPPYSLNTQEKVREKLLGDTPFYSVIRLYTKDKPAQLAPSFFAHLEKQWKELILSVKKVIIVGVSPETYLDDPHIWDSLRDTSADIFYIGNESKYKKWHVESGRAGNTIFCGNRFSDSLTGVLKMLD